jgi:hypothetical protein
LLDGLHAVQQAATPRADDDLDRGSESSAAVACRGILSDLFPGVALPHVDYSDLLAALSSNAARAGLQPLPAFLEKAIQLYEMILVRHGLMLVGRSFGMKTSALRTLAAALGDLCAEDKSEFKVGGASPMARSPINPSDVVFLLGCSYDGGIVR